MSSSSLRPRLFENVANPSGVEKFQTIQFGSPGTLLHRTVYVDKHTGKEISPLHGIPLYKVEDQINFVCTTPRESWLSVEIAADEPLNPLRVQKKEGKPSHYKGNCPWNVGLIPQTWGEADLACEDFGFLPYEIGPLEIIDVGSRVPKMGEIYAVKPLAAIAVVEHSHKLAWKIVAIDMEDPIAEHVSDLLDVQKTSPGLLPDIREWLKTCKCSESGDMPRVFGLNGRPQPKSVAMRVIAQTHGSWQLLQDQLGEEWTQIGGEAMTADAYERAWQPYTRQLSAACIPLADESEERTPYTVMTTTVTRSSTLRRTSSEASTMKLEGPKGSKSGPMKAVSLGIEATRERTFIPLKGKAPGRFRGRMASPQQRMGVEPYRQEDLSREDRAGASMPPRKGSSGTLQIQIPFKDGAGDLLDSPPVPGLRRTRSVESSLSKTALPSQGTESAAGNGKWVATIESSDSSARTMVFSMHAPSSTMRSASLPSPRTPKTPKTPRTPTRTFSLKSPKVNKVEDPWSTDEPAALLVPELQLPPRNRQMSTGKTTPKSILKKTSSVRSSPCSERELSGSRCVPDGKTVSIAPAPQREKSADYLWEEAVKQFSMTLGKSVQLELSDEDKCSLEWEFSSQDSSFSSFADRSVSAELSQLLQR